MCEISTLGVTISQAYYTALILEYSIKDHRHRSRPSCMALKESTIVHPYVRSSR
jgi:hypothetical protein